MNAATTKSSSSNLIARDGVIVCGAIHGPLSSEQCAANGCKGCKRHLAKLAAPAEPSTMDKLNAITLVW